MESVSVIIPAYNEEKAIEQVIKGIKGIKGIQKQGWEIIVVDDGSEDRTQEISARAGATVIRHPYNKGYGASLKTGIKKAKGNIIIFFDADGQHDPNDIERIAEHTGEFDMVVGVRSKDSHQEYRRILGKRIISIVANYLSGTKIPDVNSGLRAFKKDVLMRYLHLMPEGFSFSTTSTLVMLKRGYNIKYIPIRTEKRIGKSSVKQVKHGLEAIILILRMIILFEPLKIFLIPAFILFLAGFLLLLFNIFIEHNVADTTVLLLITSTILFFFGLLTDQVSAMRREKNE